MAPRAGWLLLLGMLLLAPLGSAWAGGLPRLVRPAISGMPEVVVVPGPLVLAPLPEWLAAARADPPPLPGSRAMESLARLEHASIGLGVLTLRTRREVEIGARIHVTSNGPALGGWLRVELASRRLELQLPSFQVLPLRAAGGLGVEVRAILIERRF